MTSDKFYQMDIMWTFFSFITIEKLVYFYDGQWKMFVFLTENIGLFQCHNDISLKYFIKINFL